MTLAAGTTGPARESPVRPLIRVGRGLDAAALRTLDPSDLARFLGAQRWFGAKGATPRSVRVDDVLPIVGGAVLARITVELDDGRRTRQQLPLVVRAAADASDVPDHAVLARVQTERGAGLLFDAVFDPEFRGALWRAVRDGAETEHDGERWIATPVGPAADRADADGKVVGAEQSNTSIVYGDVAIVKLYRRLEPGENPDVEIGAFLTTRAHFRHVPALLGTVRLVDRDGATTYAVIAQQYVPSTGDGWAWALASLEEHVAAPDGTPPAFARDAARLGEITRGLHDALASAPDDPTFAPEPITSIELRGWLESVGRSITAGLDLVETRWKQGALASELEPQVRALVARRGEALAYAGEIVAGVSGRAGARIRHHGDYHLGQTLHTRDGDFVVIDFEGEPARPLEERRRKHSALRDVAGMLRSFDYAASAVGARLLEPAAGDGAPASGDAAAGPDDARRRARADAWRQAARDAFLGAYFGSDDAALPAYLPPDRDDAFRLIALFEIEKAFYELAYELNNRPAWVAIPLAGVLRVLEDAP